MFDTEKCKEIFNTLSSNYLKKINDEETVAKLTSLGVDKTTKLADNISKQIQDIKNRIPKPVVQMDIEFSKDNATDVASEPKKIKPRKSAQVTEGDIL